MNKHFIRGLLASLTVFSLMMLWLFVGMFFEAEAVDSPIAFTMQRHWFLIWTTLSLGISFMVMAFVAICSFLIAKLKRVQN